MMSLFGPWLRRMVAGSLAVLTVFSAKPALCIMEQSNGDIVTDAMMVLSLTGAVGCSVAVGFVAGRNLAPRRSMDATRGAGLLAMAGGTLAIGGITSGIAAWRHKDYALGGGVPALATGIVLGVVTIAAMMIKEKPAGGSPPLSLSIVPASGPGGHAIGLAAVGRF